MTLLHRFSGVGLHRTTLLEVRAAYVAASVTAQQAMESGISQFQPFAGSSGDKLWVLWYNLQEGNRL
jgi:hypothetical protein